MLLGAALIGVAAYLSAAAGRPAYYSWLSGALLGFVFQRGRFCFQCNFAELIEHRKVRGAIAIITALAVGLIGYHVILSVWLPNPAGRLPPGAFVSPVSWAAALGGLAFGLGMALSGACVSGHLYRLGEGYLRATLALPGVLVGFGLGFLTWRPLYVEVISRAEPLWLPAMLGHSGALLLQLGVLLVLAVVLLLIARDRPRSARDEAAGRTLGALYRQVFVRRWPPHLTGAAVGVIGVVAYFRVEPLGVTAQLSSLSRTALDSWGLLSGRLPGMDTLAGCIAIVSEVILNNGWLVIAFVLGAALAARLAGAVRVEVPTVGNGVTAALGGVLLGWGSLTALGCTVGALLSGISAGAVSGWLFLAACFLGSWLGLRLGLQRIGRRG